MCMLIVVAATRKVSLKIWYYLYRGYVRQVEGLYPQLEIKASEMLKKLIAPHGDAPYHGRPNYGWYQRSARKTYKLVLIKA